MHDVLRVSPVSEFVLLAIMTELNELQTFAFSAIEKVT